MLISENSRASGSGFKLWTTLLSSVCPTPFPALIQRTRVPCELKEHKDSSPHWRGSQARPGRVTTGAGPSAIFTGPPRCCAPFAHRYSLTRPLTNYLDENLGWTCPPRGTRLRDLTVNRRFIYVRQIHRHIQFLHWHRHTNYFRIHSDAHTYTRRCNSFRILIFF